ncbi:hypothetical protein VTN02DRAFT_5541 [Thermoascus thermophilus]
MASGQEMLQAGLAAGMSATQGMHAPKLKPVDPLKSDEPYVLPENILPDTHSRLSLRGTTQDVLVPYMCIGAWSWGDTSTWNYSPDEFPHIKEAWERLRTAGLNWIDTAEAYGSGESERICGRLVEGLDRSEFVIQTKWFSVPNVTNLLSQSSAPVKRLRESLQRLKLDHVDVYLVHGPVHPSTISTVAKGLAECVRSGLTRCVGVCNYDRDDMVQMADALAKHNIPLAINQCEYSVVRRHPETHRLIRACRERGVVFQSYAPLAQGRLTGRYSQGNEPPKSYRFSSYPIQELETTIAVLRRIAEKKRVTISAVALNFNINKGTIPCVGVRSLEEAEQNMQALGWRLSPEEIRHIESVSLEGRKSVLFQQG